MKYTKHVLGKAIAGIALALLMIVQCVPAAALAQQDEAEAAMLSTQSSKSVIKGNGWKLTLPTYWRGKVKTSSHVYDGELYLDVLSKKGRSKGLTLAHIAEVDDSVVKCYPHSTRNKVKLKNGKKAKVASMQYRSYYSRGAVGFFVKLKTGKYLSVSVYAPYVGDRGAMLGRLPGKARLGHFAKLQSLGKTSKYGSGSQLACLKGLAKRLSY